MSLYKMKHVLAIERDSLLSDIDDLKLSLNLHQFHNNPSNRQKATIEARQSTIPLQC